MSSKAEKDEIAPNYLALHAHIGPEDLPEGMIIRLYGPWVADEDYRVAGRGDDHGVPIDHVESGKEYRLAARMMKAVVVSLEEARLHDFAHALIKPSNDEEHDAAPAVEVSPENQPAALDQMDDAFGDVPTDGMLASDFEVDDAQVLEAELLEDSGGSDDPLDDLFGSSPFGSSPRG